MVLLFVDFIGMCVKKKILKKKKMLGQLMINNKNTKYYYIPMRLSYIYSLYDDHF